MIVRDDILSMEFLKKSEYTGCHKGMRYRMEQVVQEESRKLKVTIWPEPFNFYKTPEKKKESRLFDFEEDGIVDAIGWMNNRLFEEKEKWEQAPQNWENDTEI